MPTTDPQSAPVEYETPEEEMAWLEEQGRLYELEVQAQIQSITDEGFADSIIPTIEMILNPTRWSPEYNPELRYRDLSRVFLRMVAIRDLEKGGATES